MKQPWFLIFVLVMLWGLLPQPTAAQSGLWTGEYFNNPDLVGRPLLVLTENSPSHDWGVGSPGIGLPADYFSARWATSQYLDSGTYQINVRADDGVRVFVDGVVYINEWHPSPGNTYTASVTLPAGQHTIVVDYFEATGNAYLQYSFALVGGGIPGTAQATVTANELNVRNIPNPFTGAVLTRIYRGQTYPIIGRNADTSWIQLNVNGIVGWVNASYTAATNLQNVPITDPSTRPTNPTGAFATVTTGMLNVRNIPNPFTGVVLTRISRGQTYPIVGRNADTSWLQLYVNGVVGWVNASYVSATGLPNVPVTDPGTRPTNPGVAVATVTSYALNVRNIPNPYFGVILTRIRHGETYNVIGRNANNSWLQLNVNGIIGWVNARFVAAVNLQNVPITG